MLCIVYLSVNEGSSIYHYVITFVSVWLSCFFFFFFLSFSKPAEVEGPPPPDCCAIRETWKHEFDLSQFKNFAVSFIMNFDVP